MTHTRNGDINTTVLNRLDGFFTLHDGTTLDIVAMLDERGNVANPETAIIGIYELPCDELYRAVDLRLFADDLGNEPICPTSPTINCTAVNRRDRYFRLEDGSRMAIGTILDIGLRPTSDPDAAVVAIFQLPDGCYRGVDLRAMDDPDAQEILH